jgi:hypothetical protein
MLGVTSRSPVPDAQPGRVTQTARQPGVSAFLKNNTRYQPGWQEIVDFS